jgi:hypothetical protein
MRVLHKKRLPAPELWKKRLPAPELWIIVCCRGIDILE